MAKNRFESIPSKNKSSILDELIEEATTKKESSPSEEVKKEVSLEIQKEPVKKTEKEVSLPIKEVKKEVKKTSSKASIKPQLSNDKNTSTSAIKYSEVNKNGKYNLQKKTISNKKELAGLSRTFLIRPDLQEIIDDVCDNKRGMKAALFHNALINELVRLGVLDEDSLTELRDY